VPSRFVHNSITLKSPHPVQVIPLALDNNALNPLHPDRQKFSLPPNTFLFLLTFDFYSSMERKNPIASIRAFSQLIASGKSNTQKVHLVVKTSNAHADPASAESLNEALRSIPNAKYTLIEQTLPREEMLQLINTCDALIALHRSEGFGLHLSEAMAMGKSVLATNWSGNVDFMNETNSYPVNFKIVELQNDTGSYKKSNFWAEVDIEHAVSQMEKVLENEFAGNKMVKHNAKQQIREAHSIKRVSSIIENRIKFIEYHLGTSRV
jgi:glycosyltransferase involved in cell wall biosynthesis